MQYLKQGSIGCDDILNVVRHLWKLQTEWMILVVCGQEYSDMSRRVDKELMTNISCYFLHPVGNPWELQIENIISRGCF